MQTTSDACVYFYGKIIMTTVMRCDEGGEDYVVGMSDTIKFSDADILHILL